MPRILIRKKQKTYVPELERDVVVGRAVNYYVADDKKPYSTSEGTISLQELSKPDGSKVLSGMNKEFTIITPSFIDDFRRIKRLPQAIPSKDIGIVIADCGVGPETIVVDSGTGSGAMAIGLARVCKRVVSYDIEDKHIEIALENKKNLFVNNLEIKKGDFTKGVAERDVDLVTLDLPSPWDAVESAKACLKIGGFLVSYSPNITQAVNMSNALARDDFLLIRTIEVMVRDWDIEDRRVRPDNDMVHSGFLTFARRIR